MSVSTGTGSSYSATSARDHARYSHPVLWSDDVETEVVSQTNTDIYDEETKYTSDPFLFLESPFLATKYNEYEIECESDDEELSFSELCSPSCSPSCIEVEEVPRRRVEAVWLPDLDVYPSYHDHHLNQTQQPQRRSLLRSDYSKLSHLPALSPTLLPAVKPAPFVGNTGISEERKIRCRPLSGYFGESLSPLSTVSTALPPTFPIESLPPASVLASGWDHPCINSNPRPQIDTESPLSSLLISLRGLRSSAGESES